MWRFFVAAALAAALLYCPIDDSLMHFTGTTKYEGTVTWYLWECAYNRHRFWARQGY